MTSDVFDPEHSEWEEPQPPGPASVDHDDDPLHGLRQAFADTFDEGPYTHEDRCLNFLMGQWVNYTYAKRAAHLIGDYSHYYVADDAATAIQMVGEAYPLTGFAFGRERSVVLYLETQAPDEAIETFDNVAPPQEAWELNPEKDHHRFGCDDAGVKQHHQQCRHDEPPLPNEEYVGRRDDNLAYVRLWWDS